MKYLFLLLMSVMTFAACDYLATQPDDSTIIVPTVSRDTVTMTGVECNKMGTFFQRTLNRSNFYLSSSFSTTFNSESVYNLRAHVNGVVENEPIKAFMDSDVFFFELTKCDTFYNLTVKKTDREGINSDITQLSYTFSNLNNLSLQSLKRGKAVGLKASRAIVIEKPVVAVIKQDDTDNPLSAKYLFYLVIAGRIITFFADKYKNNKALMWLTSTKDRVTFAATFLALLGVGLVAKFDSSSVNFIMDIVKSINLETIIGLFVAPLAASYGSLAGQKAYDDKKKAELKAKI